MHSLPDRGIISGKELIPLIEQVRKRLEQLETLAPGGVGCMLRLEALRYEEETGSYVLRAPTESWMRNAHGTLHGGLCITIADQAMGTVVYGYRPGEGIAPTITLHSDFHRPLIPGEDVLIRVRMESVTRTLLRAKAELYRASAPDKLCVSVGATFFYVAPESRTSM